MSSRIDIQQLSPRQKLDLIADLWDSLTRDPSALDVPEWHRQELDRRLDRMDSQPAQGLSFEQVVQSARQSLHKNK